MDAVEIVVGIACLKGAYNSGKQLASQTASGINSLRRATQEQRARLAEAVKSKSTKIAQGAEQYASKSGNGVGNITSKKAENKIRGLLSDYLGKPASQSYV